MEKFCFDVCSQESPFGYFYLKNLQRKLHFFAMLVVNFHKDRLYHKYCIENSWNSNSSFLKKDNVFQVPVVNHYMQMVEWSLVPLLQKVLGRGRCCWKQMVVPDVVDLLSALIGLLLQLIVSMVEALVLCKTSFSSLYLGVIHLVRT